LISWSRNNNRNFYSSATQSKCKHSLRILKLLKIPMAIFRFYTRLHNSSITPALIMIPPIWQNKMSRLKSSSRYPHYHDDVELFLQQVLALIVKPEDSTDISSNPQEDIQPAPF
jgi:hypothetical protein